MSQKTETLTADELLRHSSFVRSLAHGLLGDVHAAEDVAQETWIRALEKPAGNPGSLRAWLGAVTRNLAWNAQRSRAHRSAREQDAAQTEAVLGADQALLQADLLRSVALSVHRLQEPYRTTVLQRYFEGLSVAQIAARTGTPVTTVRSRLQKALDILRDDLDRDYSDAPAAWAGPLASIAKLSSRAPAGGGLTMAVKVAAVIALLSGAAYLWSGRTSPAPAAVGASGAANAALLPSPPAEELEPQPQDGAGVRRAVPSDVPAGRIQVALRVVNGAYPELGLEECGAGAASLRVLLDDRPGRPMGDRGKVSGSTDADGIWRGHVDDPGVRPLHFFVFVEPDEGYRHATAEAVLQDTDSTLSEVLITRAAHGLLKGTVVNASGQPIEGMELTFQDRRTEHEAKTDASGAFQVAGLTSVHLARIGNPGYTIYNRGKTEPMEGGGWEDLNVVLATAGTLRLKLKDRSAAPLAGAIVEVSLSEAERMPLPSSDLFGYVGGSPRATSDPNGLAEVPGVWVGRDLSVRVQHGSRAASSEWRVRGDLRFGAETSGAEPIRVDTTGVLELQSTWNDGLSIQGTVFRGGSPAPHATVEIYERQDGVAWERWVLSTSVDCDGEGRYQVSMLSPAALGPLLALASSQDADQDPEPSNSGALKGLGYVGPTPRKVVGGGAGSQLLDPNQAEEGVLQADLDLEPVQKIEGRLVDAKGQPLKHHGGGMGGHRIWVTPAGAGGPYAETSFAPLTKVSYGENGAFTVRGLVEGTYDLWVSTELKAFYTFSAGMQRFPDVVAGSRALELKLTPGAQVQVRIQTDVDPEVAASMIVLTAKYFPHDPVPGGARDEQRTFHVDGASGWPAGSSYSFAGIGGATDSGGHAQMGYSSTDQVASCDLPPLGPGWYRIGVQPTSLEGRPYLPCASQLVYLEEGEYSFSFRPLRTTSVEAQISSSQARRLAVELVDARGRSIPLEGRSGFTTPSAILPIPSDGRFVLRNVPVGAYRLRAGTPAGLAAGEALGEVEVQWTLTDSAPVTIELR